MKLFWAALLAAHAAWGQTPPLYKNADAPLEKRVDDLLSRMTVEEKVSQMMNDSPAIERLGIPAYNWWNECLHGVARAGRATVFPMPIGLAATWDPELIFRMATAISDEARAKNNEFIRRGKRSIYQGLTFWTPNINLVRDPRWGRGMETYGEDPYLVGRMAVAVHQGTARQRSEVSEGGGHRQALRRAQRAGIVAPQLRRQGGRGGPRRTATCRTSRRRFAKAARTR